MSKIPWSSQHCFLLQDAPNQDDIAQFRQSLLDAVEPEDAGPPLTGEELMQLLLDKYGKAYDLRIATKCVPDLVACRCPSRCTDAQWIGVLGANRCKTLAFVLRPC